MASFTISHHLPPPSLLAYTEGMGLRDELLKRIERKRQDIATLESQIRESSSYVQALEDTLKLLPRDGLNDGGAEQVLRPTSSVFRAREAIRKAGRPMHITELLEAIGKPGDRMNRSALGGSIAAYVRKGEIFTRPAPNTFGLLELGNSVELPLNFGEENANGV